LSLVAPGVLPPEKVADPDRNRRFTQEAKAASALNRGHILGDGSVSVA